MADFSFFGSHESWVSTSATDKAIVGMDITDNGTVFMSAHVDDNGVMVIDDIQHVNTTNTGAVPADNDIFKYNKTTHFWGCGLCTCDNPPDLPVVKAQKVIDEWMSDLDDKDLAHLVLMLPAGNGIRDMARWNLGRRINGKTTNGARETGTGA